MDPHYFGFTVVVLLKNFLLYSLPTRTLMNEIIDNDIFSILTVVVVALKKGTLLQWSPFSFQLISYDWI